MKYFFSFLLLCLLAENVFNRPQKISSRLSKMISKLKEKSIRKLQGTDTTEEGNQTEIVEPIPIDNYIPTGDTEAETGNATASDAKVPATKPYSKNYKRGNKNANIQFMKFHSFKFDSTSKKISFSTFFYFIARRIPHFIIFRLRITYNSRLRNLADTQADSVRTDCEIDDDDPSKDGTELSSTTGATVNYKCEANATGDATNAQIAINTDFDMVLKDKNGTVETIGFDKINFNGNSASEAENIQNSVEKLTGFATLKNTKAETSGYILKLTGQLVDNSQSSLRILTIKAGDKITMDIPNNEDVATNYPCTTEGSTSQFVLNCNTESKPLTTSPKNLHLTSGNSTDKTYLLVEMSNPTDTNTLSTVQETVKNKKSSSGLSGGAIAGIVIACVVVLVGAAIAVILIRKPSRPPIETTTVIGLGNQAI